MSDTFSVIPAPERRRRVTCETCLGDALIEVEDCTCGQDCTCSPGQVCDCHEPWCGVMPCPEGCADE
jgi:hypothetical protein